MLRLAALIMLPALAAFAQDDITKAAHNPYDLARFVESHNVIDWPAAWQALGVEPMDLALCGRDEAPPCDTEAIRVSNPDQVILLLMGTHDLYLRFLPQTNGSWRCVGANAVEMRNHPRRHEIDLSNGRPYLRVSSQGSHGSGLDAESEKWFDLTQPGFEPVFSFVANGYQQGFEYNINRRITTNMEPGKGVIYVNLQINFFGQDSDEHSLGTTSVDGVYARLPGSKEFTLQRASIGKQRIPIADFQSLASLGDDNPPDALLIHYDLADLTLIAIGPEDSTKAWLRRFLAHTTSTPEVEELRTLIRGL